MKKEIEKSEYDRLKSREEKYLAYMDMLSYRGEDKTEVDTLCGKIAELEEENKMLKEENEYRKKIADVLPEGEGHIAEETIQDLQKEIKNLKLIQETNEKQIQNDIKERDELREEIKNLKEERDKYYAEWHLRHS